MAKVALLQEAPKRYGVYDKTKDNYTTDFQYGVIVYAVVEEMVKVIMLRVTAVGC